MDVIYEVDEITESINSISLEQQLYASGYIQNMQSDIQQSDINMQSDIVEEMDALSIKDLPDFAKDQLVIDLFQHNLDIYDSSTIDKYEKKMYLDIPNVYCNGISYGLDDEDFIHTKLKLPARIKYIINGNKEEADFAGESGIPSYVINFIEKNKININFCEIDVDSNNIYAKIIYIYQFVNYYYNDLKYLPALDRINHMSNELLIWVDNITTILRNTIDNSGLSIDLSDLNDTNESKSNSNIYINTLDIFRESRNIKEDYVKSLIYGLNLIVCHLKMILNHHKMYQIPLYRMEEAHINKFFNILNNLCIIMIYIKLV
jgi:hypothetical protein